MPYSHETARLSTPAVGQFGIGDASSSGAEDTSSHEMPGKIKGKA
jgi:hypothetical protein